MRFMLMMHVPGSARDYKVNDWAPEDFKAHIAFMHGLNQELTKAGELLGAEGLAPPGQAKVVRTGKGGVPAVTDGRQPSLRPVGSQKLNSRNCIDQRERAEILKPD